MASSPDAEFHLARRGVPQSYGGSVRVTDKNRRPVVVAERILGRSFYKRRRVVKGLRPPMRRPRRRAASAEEIGRDDAMVWP